MSLVVKWWIEDSIDREKLVLGIPLFGMSFEQVRDDYGKGRGPSDGSTPDTWNDDIIGRCDYRALPLPGHKVYHDE